MNRMENKVKSDTLDLKKQLLIQAVSCLPKKILGMHGRDNISEFVLQELGMGFDLARAAYVVDNPDFDCLKGIVGFDRGQAYISDSSIWQDPEPFTAHMRSAAYNQQVRNFTTNSFIKKGAVESEIVKSIADDLGFKNPLFYAWPIKYDNHGLLLYEKSEQGQCDCDYLLDGLCLLGLCPIF